MRSALVLMTASIAIAQTGSSFAAHATLMPVGMETASAATDFARPAATAIAQSAPAPASKPPAAAPAPPTSQSSPASRKEIPWAAMRPYFLEIIGVRREAQDRYTLIVLPPGTGGDLDPLLRVAAHEAMTAAAPDVAWLVGEVFFRRFEASASVARGDVIRPNSRYIEALLDVGPFTDPLRRFTEASLRSRGIRCTDCLTGLRPVRDFTFAEVRFYIERFVYVKSIDSEGEDDRVELHVADGENALPELGLANQDVAGAVHAAMNGALRASDDLAKAIRRILNEELESLGDDRSQTARSKLNRAVQKRVGSDPEVMRPIFERLPEALERHGARCPACPKPDSFK